MKKGRGVSGAHIVIRNTLNLWSKESTTTSLPIKEWPNDFLYWFIDRMKPMATMEIFYLNFSSLKLRETASLLC